MRRPIMRHPRPLEMGPESPGLERRVGWDPACRREARQTDRKEPGEFDAV